MTVGDVSTGLVIEVIDGSERHELTTAINEALLLGSVRQHELTEAAYLSNALLQGEIKERTLAEEQLEETQTQLIYQASELEAIVAERTAELTKSNQQLEAFIYSIAHDIRAPLRAIQGFSELMMEEAGETLNAAGRGYVERINKSAQFMDAMLIDLLEFSHVSQGQIELESIDVESIIRNVLFQLQTLIEDSSGNVECVSLWPAVLAHRRTLSQVLINLVTNALKFVEAGISPQIIIRAEERQDFIRIWVEDNGIGIAPNHHEQIFGVFRRLKPGKYPGTGIGLAIVQRGVERMGGQLGVNSVPNQGSRFWFELRKA